MASETLISVASTTDSERAVQSAANCEQPSDDPVGACSVETNVVDESENQDGSIVSVENPRSERQLLQEKLLEERTAALDFQNQVASQDREQEESQPEAEAQPQEVQPQVAGEDPRTPAFWQRMGVLQQNPEIREVLTNVPDDLPIPVAVAREIARSPYGPDLAIILATLQIGAWGIGIYLLISYRRG